MVWPKASAWSPGRIRSSRPQSRGKRGPRRGRAVCSCLGAPGATRRVAPDAPRQLELSGWVIWACHTQKAPLYGYKRRGRGVRCIFPKCSIHRPVGFLADHDVGFTVGLSSSLARLSRAAHTGPDHRACRLFFRQLRPFLAVQTQRVRTQPPIRKRGGASYPL